MRAASHGRAADCAGAANSKENTGPLFGFAFFQRVDSLAQGMLLLGRVDKARAQGLRRWAGMDALLPQCPGQLARPGAAGCIAPLFPKALIPGICSVCPQAGFRAEFVSWKKQIPPKPAKLGSPCTSFLSHL